MARYGWLLVARTKLRGCDGYRSCISVS